MKVINQSFKVEYKYPVIFTEGMFEKENESLVRVMASGDVSGAKKALIVIDRGVTDHHPKLVRQIKRYFSFYHEHIELVSKPVLVTGGEDSKNNPKHLQRVLAHINKTGLCRHSYLIVIGGGAVIDMVGYAAATAHRGIRHIRIPTTVLSQNDSGIGVKNSVNAFGKKNFIGTFAPPAAVINDHTFLTTLDDRDWRSGIAEAIKVALIKDEDFFRWIQSNAAKLASRNMDCMIELIYRCAQLHLEHIAGGDPFEMGSSRPLDFGHWSSHKLEQMTNFDIRHGEAVAIGIALDSTYSYLSGMLSQSELEEIIHLTKCLKFQLYVPELSRDIELEDGDSVLSGLQEFREHLGGELTVMLLDKIGAGVEVNHLDASRIRESIALLKNYHRELAKC